MRTLFLGSYGYGNLGDELCLIDAVKAFPTTEAWAFSFNPDYTRRCTGVENYIRQRDEIFNLKPERIVLGGGGVGFWPSLRDSLHWMWSSRGSRNNAELHVYNIGVAKITEPGWWSNEEVRSVLGNLKSFSVRDHVSQWLTQEWGFAPVPGLTYYPERRLPPQPFPLSRPKGRLVGFSITGQQTMLDAMELNRDRIQDYLASLGDFTAVPVISTVQTNPEEDDIRGFHFFAERFLSGREIWMPEFLDRDWIAQELTPLRLKYLISLLDLIVSQRKHNIIHAIGCGTKFTAIFPEQDDSLLRIFFSLRFAIQPGSTVLPLLTGEFAGKY